jgi:hypothetical protein
MGKKGIKLRAWTTVDVRMLKTLAHEKTKTTEIARRLNRSVEATHQEATRLGVDAGSWSKEAGVKDAATVPFMVIFGTVGLGHRRPFGLGSFATVGRSATADRHVRLLGSNRLGGLQLAKAGWHQKDK